MSLKKVLDLYILLAIYDNDMLTEVQALLAVSFQVFIVLQSRILVFHDVTLRH